ncbi:MULTISPECIES: hypothetical protein [Flavobacterium]|uniref:HTH cro/C1-type domain-containing protein n=1 Tax=Flavobacterium jumunjinense TaxID=998845 RepID=A0ABV5GQ43_9FLAO|nr:MULTISPECIES: hypothetical protein [Flavobacterium]
MQTFFKRLLHIVEFQGFKNINDFALNGLKYESSSKLNRLKDDTNKPSVDILLDIAKRFNNIDTHWLLTGEGDFLLSRKNANLQDPSEEYRSEASIQLTKNYASLKESVVLKDEIIQSLKDKIEIQEKQLKPFIDLIEQLEARLSTVESFQEVIKQKIND